MKLPKSLETARANSAFYLSQDERDIYKHGFNKGVAAVLASAELKGLVEGIERLAKTDVTEAPTSNWLREWRNDAKISAHEILKRWQEWIKE